MEIRVTNGFDFDGYRIVEYMGVVSGESVMGTGFLSEGFAAIADLFGEPSDKFSEKIQESRQRAMAVLEKNAEALKADAVIGVHFDYFTLGSNMIAVSCSGTAVLLDWLGDDQEQGLLDASARRKKPLPPAPSPSEMLCFVQKEVENCRTATEILRMCSEHELPQTQEVRQLLSDLQGIVNVENRIGVTPKVVKAFIDRVKNLHAE